MMTSRERFEAVCGHRLPDRYPIDYLAHPETDERLRNYYGVATEIDLLQKLGADFYYLSCRDISQNESCLPLYRGPKLHRTERERMCPLGIRWVRGAYQSKFCVDQAEAGPLENAGSPQDILNHPWPQPQWFDLNPLVAECEAHADRIIIGGFWSSILGDCFRMLGFENFLLNMAMNSELVRTLVNRMTDFYLELNERAFAAMKGKMDIFFYGSDFGTQKGLLFSKPVWEELFFDNMKKLADLAKSYGLKVMFHSCGAVSELIPGLIESGVDILDPVQVNAIGMEPASIKDAYGARIVFHGGVDTQHILPHGTVDAVRRHAVDIMKTLGRDGGYIFAPSQILGPDIPPENIDAMYRAAADFRPRDVRS